MGIFRKNGEASVTLEIANNEITCPVSAKFPVTSGMGVRIGTTTCHKFLMEIEITCGYFPWKVVQQMSHQPIALRLRHVNMLWLTSTFQHLSAPRRLRDFSGTVEGHPVVLCVASLRSQEIIIPSGHVSVPRVSLGDKAPVAHRDNLITHPLLPAFLRHLTSLLHYRCPWGYLPNKLLALESLFQGMLLGELNLGKIASNIIPSWSHLATNTKGDWRWQVLQEKLRWLRCGS